LASLIYKPPSGGDLEAVEVRVPGGSMIYTFMPGVPKDVLPEHVAYVTTTLGALEGTIPTPAAPGVALQGASGSTSYTYEVVAYNANGDGIPSATTTIANGNSNLGGGNGNVVTWSAPAAALAGAITGYKVVRTAGGPSQGLIGTVLASSPLTFTDTGGAATVYTPSATNPNQIVVATGPGEI
jgi:hypothetical protein